MKNRIKKRIGLIVSCVLISSILFGCKAVHEPDMSDPTYMRILYQVELDESVNATRYESVVTVIGSEVSAHSYMGHYYDVELGGESTWVFDENQLYELMSGVVLPCKENDGTVNDYILYLLYPCDMNDMLFYYCGERAETQLTLTWHYDSRGYRIIDKFDTGLVEERYIEYWDEVSQKSGYVPPLKECDYVFEGRLPVYADDQAVLDLQVVKEKYPDVKPYGIDYPVEE